MYDKHIHITTYIYIYIYIYIAAAQAMALFQEAADVGDSDAQFLLGSLYVVARFPNSVVLLLLSLLLFSV